MPKSVQIVHQSEVITCEATVQNCDVRGLARARTADGVLVWTLEQDGGLVVIDAKKKHVVFQVPRTTITCITADASGNVWCGTLEGTVRMWGPEFREADIAERHAGPVTCMASHGDCVYVAGGEAYCSIYKWNAVVMAVIRKFTPVSSAFRGLVADATRVYSITDDCSVRVWDAEAGTCLHEWNSPRRTFYHSLCQWGDTLWTGGRDGRITVWDKSEGRMVRVLSPAHEGAVQSLTVVGNTVWSGAADHVLRVWHGKSLFLVAERSEHRGPIYSILSVGRWVFDEVWTSSGDQAMKVWNVATLHTPESPKPDSPRSSIGGPVAKDLAQITQLEQLLEEERERNTQLRTRVHALERDVGQKERQHREQTRDLQQQLQSRPSPSRRPISPQVSPRCPQLRLPSPSTGKRPPSAVTVVGAPVIVTTPRQSPTIQTRSIDLTAPSPPKLPSFHADAPVIQTDFSHLLNCPKGREVETIRALLEGQKELQALRSTEKERQWQDQQASGNGPDVKYNPQQPEVLQLHAANLELDALNRRLLKSGELQAAKLKEYERTIKSLDRSGPSNAEVAKLRQTNQDLEALVGRLRGMSEQHTARLADYERTIETLTQEIETLQQLGASDELHAANLKLDALNQLQAAKLQEYERTLGGDTATDIAKLHAANMELDSLNQRLLVNGEHQAAKLAEYERMIQNLSDKRTGTADQKFVEDSRAALLKNLHRLYEQVDAARDCGEALYTGAFQPGPKRIKGEAVPDLMLRMTEVLSQLTGDYRWTLANFLTYREKKELGLSPKAFAPDPSTVKLSPGAFEKPVSTSTKPKTKSRNTSPNAPTRVARPAKAFRHTPSPSSWSIAELSGSEGLLAGRRNSLKSSASERSSPNAPIPAESKSCARRSRSSKAQKTPHPGDTRQSKSSSLSPMRAPKGKPKALPAAVTPDPIVLDFSMCSEASVSSIEPVPEPLETDPAPYSLAPPPQPHPK